MIEEVFAKQLLNFGMAGLFILYMIYDKQVLQKKMIKTIENNTSALNGIVITLQSCKLKK